jgi:hypothetical protein
MAKKWKQPKCLSADEINFKNVVCSYNGILFSYKMNKVVVTGYNTDKP